MCLVCICLYVRLFLSGDHDGKAFSFLFFLKLTPLTLNLPLNRQTSVQKPLMFRMFFVCFFFRCVSSPCQLSCFITSFIKSRNHIHSSENTLPLRLDCTTWSDVRGYVSFSVFTSSILYLYQATPHPASSPVSSSRQ